MTDIAKITKTLLIHAPVQAVWNILTQPESMERWLSDAEMTVTSDLRIGGALTFAGTLHGMAFKDKGTVLKLEPCRVFSYNYWPTVSRLPDKPENYTVFEFQLRPNREHTELTFTARNFPGKASYEHNRFYWNVTLEVLKKMVENTHTGHPIP